MFLTAQRDGRLTQRRNQLPLELVLLERVRPQHPKERALSKPPQAAQRALRPVLQLRHGDEVREHRLQRRDTRSILGNAFTRLDGTVPGAWTREWHQFERYVLAQVAVAPDPVRESVRIAAGEIGKL